MAVPPKYWYYKDSRVHSIQDLPSKAQQATGFVYLISNLTNGKKYIGKKLLYTKHHKETDWIKYTGSCNALNADINKGDKIRKDILHFCYSRGDLSYKELLLQVKHKVLLEQTYYNGIIRVRINRTHLNANKNRTG